MPGLYEKIRRLLRPDLAERGAEDDVIDRAPEGVRGRLQDITQRRRMIEDEEKRRRRQADNQDRMHREGTKAADLG